MITELTRPRMIKEFENINISRNQLTILKILYSQGPQPAHRIARMLGISRAAVSQNIDILVNINFVFRKQSRSDRRSVSISIRKAGTIFLMQYDDILRDRQYSAIVNFSLEEQTQFNQSLEKYISAMISQEQNLEIVCLGCHESLEYDCFIKQTYGHCVQDNPELQDLKIF